MNMWYTSTWTMTLSGGGSYTTPRLVVLVRFACQATQMQCGSATCSRQELLATLKNTPKDDRDRSASMCLYHQIRKLARNPLLGQLFNFMDSCVHIMALYADSQVAHEGPQEGGPIYFKYLSTLGYEPECSASPVQCSGLPCSLTLCLKWQTRYTKT